nr:hypothetical protein [Tanacetum cinerariifolium]
MNLISLVIFFLPSMTSLSQVFSRVDALPSTNNEDKVFNPVILSQENSFEIITRVVQDKKLAIFNASLMLEDFDPPFYEPFFFKEVPSSKMILPFSSENEEKVFKPGIHTSEKVYSSFILELSHQGYKVFKINQIFKSLMKELADELALITFPPKYDDDLQFDVESDLKEIEFLLYHDIDSSLKDSIDQSNLDNFVDFVPEMFTDEHAIDYSSPSLLDEYDDDF